MSFTSLNPFGKSTRRGAVTPEARWVGMGVGPHSGVPISCPGPTPAGRPAGGLFQYAKHLFSNSQSGALFGLDARIALAIFSILSVVAGVAVIVNIDSTRAQVLATELADTGQALESFHHDLKTDIFLSLITPTGKNAFQALYDNAVITEGGSDGENLRARWNGPYIKFTSNINARYGEMLLTKAGPDHNQPCEPESICYLYLIYSKVKPSIALDANKVLDGDHEQGPERTGRLQWTQDADDNVAIHFRTLRALSPNMDY